MLRLTLLSPHAARPALACFKACAAACATASVVLCLLAVPHANAQDANKPNREREELRRAQAALQQMAAERDALTVARATLAGQLAAAQAEVLTQQTKAQSAVRALHASSVQQATTLARQQAEWAASRTAAQDAATAAAEASRGQEQALQQQLATLRSENAGRAQTVAALVQLLERSTAALAAAESANARLFAAGLEAVSRLRSKTPEDLQAQADPWLGLRAVQIENQAEALRSALDKHRMTR